MSNEKVYIITLTGDLGSGKGTVSQIIESQFGFVTYCTGDVQRELAKNYNMTTLELNEYSETHPEIDDEIDSCFASLANAKVNIIIDSRMAWHFIPKSFKVYLKVDIEVAAKRIISADRGGVESYEDIEEAKNKIIERKSSENRRYLAKYGVNSSDMNNFDLVIDSSDLVPQEIADIILKKAKEFFETSL